MPRRYLGVIRHTVHKGKPVIPLPYDQSAFIRQCEGELYRQMLALQARIEELERERDASLLITLERLSREGRQHGTE